MVIQALFGIIFRQQSFRLSTIMNWLQRVPIKCCRESTLQYNGLLHCDKSVPTTTKLAVLVFTLSLTKGEIVQYRNTRRQQ